MADKNKKNTRNPQSVLFRRLTKLLSGPLTQYRTQNNHKLRRIDLDKYATRFKSASGRDFKKTAYNPYDNFHLRQVPETVGLTDMENPWADFEDLLLKLRNRDITGNAARDAVDHMSKRFDSDEWNNFCRNVIRKDLRCGISDKTFNKVVKKSQYEIPICGCQ